MIFFANLVEFLIVQNSGRLSNTTRSNFCYEQNYHLVQTQDFKISSWYSNNNPQSQKNLSSDKGSLTLLKKL